MELVTVLYKLIANTRDIVAGKGEYSLAYMLLLTWHTHYPVLARRMLDFFVEMDDGAEHPYGSWKDIKYFAELCKNEDTKHPLILYCVHLINHRIRKDVALSDTKNSLVAKWVPREKSKFGWLFSMLALNYFKDEFMPHHTTDTHPNYNKAFLKCKTHYRKLVSSLNKTIDTVQILQCANEWSSIVPCRQTSITMKRQSKAFLNVTKKGDQRHNTADREECAANFKNYISQAVNGEVSIKGKRVGLNEFVKEAIELNYSNNQSLKDLLDAQWLDNASQNKALDKFIPMVDVSGSMSGDPMHSAIALGIRVSEKSIIGNRIMTFSETPTWVKLDGITSFVDKVNIIQKAPWGMNTNFMMALTLILDVIVEKKMSPEDVKDMTLAIFSDMQIDQADHNGKSDTMFESIKNMYAEAGRRVHGEPYKPPHILFWNLRSTSGFPVISSQTNTSMMSGFSPVLLNQFCENGSCSFSTPWDMFISTLSHERYTHLNEIVSGSSDI